MLNVRQSDNMMTATAQVRIAALPAELRLQILEAAMLHNRSIFDITNITQAEKVTEEAAHLFDGEQIKHLERAIYEVLEKSAEEAFFKNAIFKICLDINQPNLDFTCDLEAPFLEHINYMHIDIRISRSNNYTQAVYNLAETWTKIKTRLPKLKACVLTLQLRTCEEDYARPRDVEGGMHALRHDNKPFPGRLLVIPDLPDLEYKAVTTLQTTLARIFGDFAENMPAQRCFARILHEQYDRDSSLLRRHCGYLMPVRRDDGRDESQSGERGEKILFETYRCARTVDPNIRDLEPESDMLEGLSLGDMFGG